MGRGVRVIGVAAAVAMTVGLGLAATGTSDPAGSTDPLAVTDVSAAGGEMDRDVVQPISRKGRGAGRPAPRPPAPAVPADSTATGEPGATTGAPSGGTTGAPPGGTTGGTTSGAPTSTGPDTTAQPPVPNSPAPAPTPQAPPTSPAPAPAAGGVGSMLHQSGMPWRSGVYLPGSNAATSESFGAWRGRPLDVVVDWSARQTWDEIVNPDWLYRAWSQTPYTKALGVAMVPEGDSSATIARCATGAYDDKWRQFGRNIAAAGMADTTVVRLGWEFNGNWYKWSAYDPAAWAECWRQIVTAAEETAPGLRWDWTVNRGAGQSLRDARQAYPGDAYVDIVGVDSYDMYPGVRTEAQWQEHYSGEYGLKFWADFARAHGKHLSVPEWGVYPGTLHAGHNGGDNPFYVRKMVEFFGSLGPLLAYEAYFNDKGAYYAGSLFSPVQAPQAADAYRRLYGG